MFSMRFSFYIFFLIIFFIGAARADEKNAGREERIKHEKSWWKSFKPIGETPEKQLAYADSLKKAGKIGSARSEYCALVYTWPESAQAPAAQLNYARLLEESGKLAKAFDEYQFLIETYPGFFDYDEVMERQFNIADKLANRNRYFLIFRYRSPEDAIPLFEKMIQNGMQWKKSSELQFRIARIYEKTGQYDLATDAYALYHQRYPMGPLAEQAVFGQAKCCYHYAQENRNAGNLRENASATLRGFLDWYPRSDMAPQARRYLQEMDMDAAVLLYDQARIYLQAVSLADDKEEKTKCLTGAKISFQRLIYEFPYSRWADTAKARLRQIDERLGELQ